MNFQLRRFIHNARQSLEFDVVLSLMILAFLAMLTSLGIYCAWEKIERKRISCGAATGLTPAPADAEPEAPRK